MAATVVVVGAGPAGIAASCAAAESGAQTLLLDENPTPGGQIWRSGVAAPPPEAQAWLERLTSSAARIEHGASVFDIGESSLWVEQDGQAVEVTYERLVLATGARELFLPFPGWTLPEVMGIGGIQALVKAGADIAGRRVVIAGSGPLILPVASHLNGKGARLQVVAEQAEAAAVRRFALGLWRSPSKLLQAARLRASFLGTRYRTSTWVVAAHGADRVESVTLTDGRSTRTLPCDLLATSYGLVANLELPRLLGCELDQCRVRVDEAQQSSVEGIYAAGELCGIGGADVALIEGEIAGLAAAAEPVPQQLIRDRVRWQTFRAQLEESFRPRAELLERATPETIVCRCEDVPWSAIDSTTSMRQAKLFHRVGMGPCQGRICGVALEHLCQWDSDSIRPPLKPVAAGTLARSVEGGS
jgi:NADPH-dependent 2,4-dienoyl-CoA reductase/sulfur reductase-like enzyme